MILLQGLVPGMDGTLDLGLGILLFAATCLVWGFVAIVRPTKPK